MRATRSSEKKRKQDEGIPEAEPKPKIMTLGKHLALIREKEEEELLENDAIAKYEQFSDYEKDTVVADLAATEVNSKKFPEHNFFVSACGDKNTNILFLTLETGDHPKNFTHFCNNSSLKWHLADLHLASSDLRVAIPGVFMVFVRGEHVQGTTKTSNTYKYLGLVGLQSMCSGSVGSKHEYLYATLIFDYNLSRKELELFGDNVMRCKKNKYRCSLCA